MIEKLTQPSPKRFLEFSLGVTCHVRMIWSLNQESLALALEDERFALPHEDEKNSHLPLKRLYFWLSDLQTFIINASGQTASEIFVLEDKAFPTAHELGIYAVLSDMDRRDLPAIEVRRVLAMIERERHLCLASLGVSFNELSDDEDFKDATRQMPITKADVAKILSMAPSAIKTHHTNDWKHALIEEGRGNQPHVYDLLKLTDILQEQFPHRVQHVLSHLKK